MPVFPFLSIHATCLHITQVTFGQQHKSCNSPFCCHFLPARTEHLSQSLILEQQQPIFFPYTEATITCWWPELLVTSATKTHR
jgi:hypothetical protein